MRKRIQGYIDRNQTEGWKTTLAILGAQQVDG